MSRRLNSSWAKWFGGLCLTVGGASLALGLGENPASVQWTAKDSKGAAVQVPVEQKATLLLFVMPEQPQSRLALAQMGAVLKEVGAVQAVVVVSGDQAAQQAGKLAVEYPWPVVADPEYAATGKLSVRVWPTAVVVDGAGKVVAHLAGLPKNFSKDLESYLAFASRRIDQAALEERLAHRDVVGDSPEQGANRHLQVAQRLLDKGMIDQARHELAEGLKLHPNFPALRVALAKVLLASGETAEALKLLEQLDRSALPAPQANLLRGKALAQMGKVEEARTLLLEAIKLNPQPAEAWYELGLLYQGQDDAANAAAAFRKAFEATETGRALVPSTRPAR